MHATAPERVATSRLRPYTGKWLIFVRCRGVKTCWDAVRAATESGRVGIGAKISAHLPLPSPKRSADAVEWAEIFPPQKRHVICVYTRDWRHVKEVLRVGRVLAEIGAVRDQLIRYKSDDQTLRGIYYGTEPVTLYVMRPPYKRLEAGAGLQGEWARIGHAKDADRVSRALRRLSGGSP